MSKELEILENLSNQEVIVKKAIGGIYMDGSVQTMLHKTTVGVAFYEQIEKLKRSLQRLESLDNANPSEALERFDYIGNDIKFAYDDDYVSYDYTDDVEYIKKALIKAQEQEKENAEYKKVLGILKNKKVDIWKFIDNGIFNYSYDDYYFCWNYYSCEKLTQEEFELLKRYFK